MARIKPTKLPGAPSCLTAKRRRAQRATRMRHAHGPSENSGPNAPSTDSDTTGDETPEHPPTFQDLINMTDDIMPCAADMLAPDGTPGYVLRASLDTLLARLDAAITAYELESASRGG